VPTYRLMGPKAAPAARWSFANHVGDADWSRGMTFVHNTLRGAGTGSGETGGSGHKFVSPRPLL